MFEKEIGQIIKYHFFIFYLLFILKGNQINNKIPYFYLFLFSAFEFDPVISVQV